VLLLNSQPIIDIEKRQQNAQAGALLENEMSPSLLNNRSSQTKRKIQPNTIHKSATNL